MDASSTAGEYVVVARRYRPQTFVDLVGQGQVAEALSRAITTSRVGHAYLFTGARGVGKTSTARIFAKCLNCVEGPTTTPCGQCDNCLSIATGEDVDVLEIDGASNRGIDEIRQLRSNVNIRPSRSRFKIYIIDEVHMLTTPAFNALLKTLEEPPEHVKFVFCTTDPEKIPITVISRCQRFDFAGIQSDAIVARLRQIVDAEGVAADDDALKLLARRAGGSMRDSQSLLEQLLAFAKDRITSQEVHRLLGTAESGRVDALVERLTHRDAAGALAELDSAIAEGVDPGQLVEQLLGYFRDAMAVCVGCSRDTMLHTGNDDFEKVTAAAKTLGLATVLAAAQILDQSIVRMRQSAHVRTLAEMAVVRICSLEQLEQIGSLLAQLQSNEDSAPSLQSRGDRTPAQKKTTGGSEPVRHYDAAHASSQSRSSAPVQRPAAAVTGAAAVTTAAAVAATSPAADHLADDDPSVSSDESNPATPSAARLTNETAQRLWREATTQMGGMGSTHGLRNSSVAISGPNRLVIGFPPAYTSSKAYFERPQQRAEVEKLLAQLAGRPIQLELAAAKEERQAASAPASSRVPQAELRRQAASHPAVQQAMELFDATVVAVQPGRSNIAEEESE